MNTRVINIPKSEQFDYEEYLLSDNILFELGFSDYHDNNGKSGDRIVLLGQIPTDETNKFTIEEYCETGDITNGYLIHPIYMSKHYKNKDTGTVMYFVSDLVSEINKSNLKPEYKKELFNRLRDINLGHYVENQLETYKFRMINSKETELIGLINGGYTEIYDGVFSFYWSRNTWKVRLFSNTVDCLKIARRYSGSGNINEAFFELDTCDFIKLIK